MRAGSGLFITLHMCIIIGNYYHTICNSANIKACYVIIVASIIFIQHNNNYCRFIIIITSLTTNTNFTGFISYNVARHNNYYVLVQPSSAAETVSSLLETFVSKAKLSTRGYNTTSNKLSFRMKVTSLNWNIMGTPNWLTF